jgi:predicted NBD/HSP70 family sugar kinase/predicted transcriptional regulator
MISAPDFYSLTENSHKQVLNIIRTHREISGAEISRLTGFQPSTILYILRILDRKGFITISRTGDSTQKGGKKPVLWKIKSDIGVMLGIEVFKSKLRFVKIDFEGKIQEQGEKPVSLTTGQDNVSGILEKSIREILSEEELNSRSFLGIGIAMPGLVDSDHGKIQYSALLQIRNLEIGERLRRRLGKPVYFVNDANAGALGISWYHPIGEKLPEHIVYLTYNKESKNLGAGLIISHNLYEGIAGTAGEIFDPLPDIPTLVRDGIKKHGSDFPLIRDHQQPEAVSFRKLADLALNGCKLSAYAVDKICDVISEEIARITGLLNPNLIVIGGDITCRSELLVKYILPGSSLKTGKMLKLGFVLPAISFSSFGEFSVAMGATAMILSKILRVKNLKTR